MRTLPPVVPDVLRSTTSVKKHAGAIHIRNTLSCLQRKIFTCLLYHAYDELGDPNIMVHRIAISELARLAGFDSKNTAYLKAALEDLVSTKIWWNILDTDEGRKRWGVSGALASAEVCGGVCTYSFSAHLRRLLYNPELYANINISVLSKLNSSAAVALYENVVRYRNAGETPFLSIEVFKELMGVKGNASYNDYKILNRAVIKPAVKEINTVSDIHIEPETQVVKRRVTAIKFRVAENAQTSLPIETTEPVLNQTLLKRLQDYCLLSRTQAAEVLKTYSEQSVEACIDYVGRQIHGGKKIKNVSAYFLTCLRDGNFDRSESAFETERREAQRRREEEQKSLSAQHEQQQIELSRRKRAAINEYLAGLAQDERKAIDAEFQAYIEQVGTPYIKQTFNRQGMKSKLIESQFYVFMEKKDIPQLKELIQGGASEPVRATA